MGFHRYVRLRTEHECQSGLITCQPEGGRKARGKHCGVPRLSCPPPLATRQPIRAKGRGQAHAPPASPTCFSVNVAVAPSSRQTSSFPLSFVFNYELFVQVLISPHLNNFELFSSWVWIHFDWARKKMVLWSDCDCLVLCCSWSNWLLMTRWWWTRLISESICWGSRCCMPLRWVDYVSSNLSWYLFFVGLFWDCILWS